MYVAIDSSHGLLYTGILSGSELKMGKLYSEMERIFTSKGVPHNFHWNKLTKKERALVKNLLSSAFMESGLHFTIIEHRKPANIEKKKYYLVHVPNRVSYVLEGWLKGKEGNVDIDVDDDYTISNVQKGTEKFIEAIIQQTCTRLIGTPVKIRKDSKIKATIMQMNGNQLSFYGQIATQECEGIRLVDILIGCYLDGALKRTKNSNVFYSKL